MANKKINQLVSKTAILSTDIFGIGDATTGQLFKKTIAELQAAIGGAVISVNGLVGTVVLDTDDIQELATPTNKYFTDARARGAISLTVTGNSGASTYSSGTGVLNVPTYTLAGLGGITASFLSGTSGISYNSGTGVISYTGTVYTDASIRALFSGSTGISYNSSTGAISYSGTVYTDASVRALISMTTTGDSGASTYNNTTGVINVPNYTLAGLGGISLTSLSGGTGITYNSSTGAISYSGTVYTDASVRALISATSPISYNNTTGVISLSGGNLTEATSSVLTITGGTGAVIGAGTSIQVKQASSTVSGFLSSTDWNTFNNKQATLTNPVTGTGTSGHVAYWNGSGSIAGSANLFWDNTNGRLGIGTTSPISKIHVDTATNSQIAISNTSVGTSWYGISSTDMVIAIETGGNILFKTGATYPTGITTGTERMRILSDGNLGLGITADNPIGNGGTYRNLLVGNGAGYAVFQGISTATATNSAIAAFGGGTTGASSANKNACSINVELDGTSTTNAIGRLVFYTANSSGIAERMRINSNGNISVGNNQGNSAFTVSEYTTGNPTKEFNIDVSNTGIVRLFAYNRNGSNIPLALQDVGGNCLIGTTTDNGERLYVSGAIRATGSITANSDISLKKNLLKIENALEKVEQINGYTYELKADDSKRHGGVIAQEIDKVFPEIVNTGNDGLMGVEYGNISALLIEAIKEQNTKIKNLETLLASK